MKATLLITATIAGLSSFAWSAVTLNMSTTSVFATNFQSKKNNDYVTKMAWGLVVDTDGSGFKGLDPMTPYYPDFNLTGGSAPQTLSTTAVDGVTKILTTNKLFVSANLMNLTGTSINDGAPGGPGAIGLNRITQLVLNYSGGVDPGDAYMVIWFDVTALGSPAPGPATNTGYGMAVLPKDVVVDAVKAPSTLKLPADPGTYAFAPGWAGADAAKPMNMVLGVPVPEPSVALLGGLGLLGLLRRRR